MVCVGGERGVGRGRGTGEEKNKENNKAEANRCRKSGAGDEREDADRETLERKIKDQEN